MLESDLHQLYARLEKKLYNVAYRWVWDADEAQDLVQEAFLRLWRMRQRVEWATVEPLVYRIVVNLAASRRRSRKIWRWISLDVLRQTPSEEPSVELDLMRRSQRDRVREAIEALPEKLRQVVLLCEYSELSYEEIAAVLHVPAGTVGSRRHHALRKLREALAADGDEERRRA